MLYSDSEPEHSFQAIVGREGDTELDVSLLPFQRSLLLVLLLVMKDNTQALFIDSDTIDQELLTDMVDDLSSRLANDI